MRKSTIWIASSCGVTLAVLIGTQAWLSRHGSRRDSERTNDTTRQASGNALPVAKGFIAAHAADKVPCHTLQDWVSYADVVGRITIMSEQQAELEGGVQRRGKGYVGRTLQARIEEVYWESPFAKMGLREGSRLKMIGLGWAYKRGELVPLKVEGKRLEVGETYILPMANFERGGWSPLSFKAVLPVREGRLEGSDLSRAKLDGSHYQRLAGIRPENIVDLLRGVSPSPKAIENRHLPHRARYLATVGAAVVPD